MPTKCVISLISIWLGLFVLALSDLKPPLRAVSLPSWDSVFFLFCCVLLCVHSSFVIILMGKRELVALLFCIPGVS